MLPMLLLCFLRMVRSCNVVHGHLFLDLFSVLAKFRDAAKAEMRVLVKLAINDDNDEVCASVMKSLASLAQNDGALKLP